MNQLLATMILMFHIHGIPKGNDENLIETTCKNTPNYQLCISTLRSNPRSKTADITDLALIMVDAIKAKAEETSNAVKKLKRTRPELRRALTDCTYRYNAILQADVPEAVEALTKGVPKFAESGMADTAVEAVSCEGNFGNVKSPLTELNDAVRELSDVARAIIRNLL